MDNTVNNVSFKANIKAFTKINNKSAFVEVKQLFENSTKKDSGDVLYITDGMFGENILELGNPEERVVMYTINKQLKSMSAPELAKKLVKIYETLKMRAKVGKKNDQLASELDRAKTLLNLNLNISKAWASEGKTHIADKYKVLAERNMKKIDALTKEKNNRLYNYNKQIDTLSEEYEELSNLKINA